MKVQCRYTLYVHVHVCMYMYVCMLYSYASYCNLSIITIQNIVHLIHMHMCICVNIALYVMYTYMYVCMYNVHNVTVDQYCTCTCSWTSFGRTSMLFYSMESFHLMNLTNWRVNELNVYTCMMPISCVHSLYWRSWRRCDFLCTKCTWMNFECVSFRKIFLDQNWVWPKGKKKHSAHTHMDKMHCLTDKWDKKKYWSKIQIYNNSCHKRFLLLKQSHSFICRWKTITYTHCT